jgi:hypothetical protein
MKTPKHTQGPWIVGEFFDSGAIDIRSENQEICLLRSEVRENQKANAALIAAAPEMYAAVVELLDALYESSGCALKPKHEQISIKALAAIRKARGES